MPRARGVGMLILPKETLFAVALLPLGCGVSIRNETPPLTRQPTQTLTARVESFGATLHGVTAQVNGQSINMTANGDTWTGIYAEEPCERILRVQYTAHYATSDNVNLSKSDPP